MIINNPSTTSVANAVWQVSTRNLTTFGTVVTQTVQIQQTVAAAGTVDLRPGAGKLRMVTGVCSATPNQFWSLFDGTNENFVNSNQQLIDCASTSPSVGVRIHNTTAGGLQEQHTLTDYVIT